MKDRLEIGAQVTTNSLWSSLHKGKNPPGVGTVIDVVDLRYGRKVKVKWAASKITQNISEYELSQSNT
jgi:hypothetical protein